MSDRKSAYNFRMVHCKQEVYIELKQEVYIERYFVLAASISDMYQMI